MIRRLALAWAALGALAWAVPADGQLAIDPNPLPDRSALGRVGLERGWFTAMPLQSGLEQVDHLSLSADGQLLFVQTTAAQLHCLDAETGRTIWTASLGPASGQAQDVGVFAESPDLLLIPSFGTVEELPAEGRFQVVVARTTRPDPSGGEPREVLYFRVFDADGTLAVDTSEDDYPGAYRQMAALKGRLRGLWGNATIPAAERKRAVAEVSAAIGYAPASQVFATNGNFLFALDRATGRPVWTARMEANASSPVAATLDLVMVGLVDGRLVAYSLVPPEDERFRRETGPPGGFAWNFATTGPITAEPIPTQFVVAFASNGGNLYVSQIDPPSILHRSQPIGPLAASMGTYGTGPQSRLIVPSMDRNLYSVDLFTGEQYWVFPTGAPIGAQPLVGGGDVTITRVVPEQVPQTVIGSDLRPYTQTVTRLVEREETIPMPPAIYVLNEAGQLFAIDPESGTSRWNQTIPVPGTEREEVDPRTGLRVPVPGSGRLALDPNTGEPSLEPRSVGTGSERILALSPTRIYLRTEYGDLAIVEREGGELVAGPSATFQRAGLDLRKFTVATTNDIHDRIYLASPYGTIVCLREQGADVPIPLRAASGAPFGFLRSTDGPEDPTPPAVPPAAQPQPPAGDQPPAAQPPGEENPFDFGFGALPARPRPIR